MTKFLNFLVSVCILALAGAAAYAEPTPLVSHLMATPVSLLTLGLVRLELAAGPNAQRAGFQAGTAGYDWDKNEIYISASSFGLNVKCNNDVECEAFVKKGLENFASNYAVHLKSGWYELVTSQFTQSGYTSKNFYDGKPLDKAAQDLDRIIKIQAFLFKDGRSHSCQRGLKEDQIYCSSN